MSETNKTFLKTIKFYGNDTIYHIPQTAEDINALPNHGERDSSKIIDIFQPSTPNAKSYLKYLHVNEDNHFSTDDKNTIPDIATVKYIIENLYNIPYRDPDTGALYYQIQDGATIVKEWISPPYLTVGENYRTVERWNGKVVYTIKLEKNIDSTEDLKAESDYYQIEVPISTVNGEIIGGNIFTVSAWFEYKDEENDNLFFKYPLPSHDSNGNIIGSFHIDDSNTIKVSIKKDFYENKYNRKLTFIVKYTF